MTSAHDALSFLHGPSMANRLMLAPLTNSQSHADGTLSDAEINWLLMRARAGFGLTMTAAAQVTPIGQGFPGQLAAYDDIHLPGLRRLAADINAAGSVSYVQLHHAGNRAPADLIGGQPVSSSDDPSTGARAMSNDEVRATIDAFVSAAQRCEAAGFHGVELHGAHGYLIGQFLSPEINRRTDEYGGSLENRARFLMETVDGVRAACGDDFALAVRLSPERFGMRLPEVMDVYGWLVDTGKVDLIDMSLWDVNKEPEDDAFKGRSLCELFAGLPRGDVRLGVAGKIHEPADVQRVLDADVDVAVLGRVAILHHDYPQRINDPDFTPRRAPVSREVLAAEGLSEPFIDYMANVHKFVA